MRSTCSRSITAASSSASRPRRRKSSGTTGSPAFVVNWARTLSARHPTRTLWPRRANDADRLWIMNVEPASCPACVTCRIVRLRSATDRALSLPGTGKERTNSLFDRVRIDAAVGACSLTHLRLQDHDARERITVARGEYARIHIRRGDRGAWQQFRHPPRRWWPSPRKSIDQQEVLVIGRSMHAQGRREVPSVSDERGRGEPR